VLTVTLTVLLPVLRRPAPTGAEAP
jgi:hypothetical protein